MKRERILSLLLALAMIGALFIVPSEKTEAAAACTHSSVITNITNPSCCYDGRVMVICNKCGKVLTSTTLKATGNHGGQLCCSAGKIKCKKSGRTFSPASLDALAGLYQKGATYNQKLGDVARRFVLNLWLQYKGVSTTKINDTKKVSTSGYGIVSTNKSVYINGKSQALNIDGYKRILTLAYNAFSKSNLKNVLSDNANNFMKNIDTVKNYIDVASTACDLCMGIQSSDPALVWNSYVKLATKNPTIKVIYKGASTLYNLMKGLESKYAINTILDWHVKEALEEEGAGAGLDGIPLVELLEGYDTIYNYIIVNGNKAEFEIFQDYLVDRIKNEFSNYIRNQGARPITFDEFLKNMKTVYGKL